MTYIESLITSPLDLKLRLPFVTALGEKQISHNLGVEVRLSDGSKGYGEASESLAMPAQTQSAMIKALEQIRKVTVGKPVKNLQSVYQLCRLAWKSTTDFPTAVAAFECALFGSYCKSQSQTLWQFFGGKKRLLHTSYTISIWPAALTGRVAREFYQGGFRQFKIKVSSDIEQDLLRVKTVAHAAPHTSLWVDANQSFTVDSALQFLSELQRFKISIHFLEQPLKKDDWKGLKELRQKTKISIALDESLQTPADAKKIIQGNLADILTIKLAKSGITGALEIIKIAKPKRLPLMISCMAESARGLTPSVHLAVGTGAFKYIDLDSHLLLDSPFDGCQFSTQGSLLKI